MNTPDVPGSASFDELLAASIGRYREACETAGVDAEAELAEARLSGGSVFEAMAERLARDEHGATVPVTEAPWVWPLLVVSEPRTQATLRAILADERVPPGLVSRVAEFGPGWRARIGARRRTPVGLLERLAGDDEVEVRRSVAGNRAAPTAVLERLAADGDVSVRKAVAGNGAVTDGLLLRLAADRDALVRRRVAGVEFAPRAVLDLLAQDRQRNVRAAALTTIGYQKWAHRGATA